MKFFKYILLLFLFTSFNQVGFSQVGADEEIFMIVEQSPRFPGCEDIVGTKEEKDGCAQKKMLEYIYGNLSYPTLARKKGIEGQVIIQFVIGIDGWLGEISLIRDIGGGCGEAAMKVVESMNEMDEGWEPGYNDDNAVRVKYTLPIKFKMRG